MLSHISATDIYTTSECLHLTFLLFKLYIKIKHETLLFYSLVPFLFIVFVENAQISSFHLGELIIVHFKILSTQYSFIPPAQNRESLYASV